jgi:ribosomal protein S9
MAKDEIVINQSVAILCDGNNIERSIHEEAGTTNAMINFDTVIPRLLNKRGLNRLIYFREGINISSKLAERLHNNYYGSVIPCHKSADIPLSIKASQLASKVDTIIIMSGDSDYLDLVVHLKAEGVRVEIAAVKKTTSKHLIEEADHFHEITRKDWFVFTGGKTHRSKKPDPKQAPKINQKKVSSENN